MKSIYQFPRNFPFATTALNFTTKNLWLLRRKNKLQCNISGPPERIPYFGRYNSSTPIAEGGEGGDIFMPTLLTCPHQDFWDSGLSVVTMVSILYLKISRVEILNRELLKDEEGWIYFFQTSVFYFHFFALDQQTWKKHLSRSCLSKLIEPFRLNFIQWLIIAIVFELILS